MKDNGKHKKQTKNLLSGFHAKKEKFRIENMLKSGNTFRKANSSDHLTVKLLWRTVATCRDKYYFCFKKRDVFLAQPATAQDRNVTNVCQQ